MTIDEAFAIVVSLTSAVTLAVTVWHCITCPTREAKLDMADAMRELASIGATAKRDYDGAVEEAQRMKRAADRISTERVRAERAHAKNNGASPAVDPDVAWLERWLANDDSAEAS